MAYRHFQYILLILVLIFSWQGCDGEDPSINASRFRLKLTDATSMLMKEFHVDIREISVFLVDSASNEGAWTTLDFQRKRYDVLKLMNGKMVQIVDQYLPAGTELQQIKLLFGSDNSMLVLTDTAKNTIPLQLAPELEDGLVIDAVKMQLLQNVISSMVVDLNASLSVLEAPDGSYILSPVARAFPETYGGKLRGYVSPIGASPQIVITLDEDTLFTLPELDPPDDPRSEVGMYQFIGLKEGEWKVHLLPHPESGFRDSVFTWKVENGKTADITPKPIQLKIIPKE